MNSGARGGRAIESIRHALQLVGGTGPYANALTLAEAYERGAWRAVQQQALASGLDTAQVSALYVQSLEWTRERLVSLVAA